VRATTFDASASSSGSSPSSRRANRRRTCSRASSRMVCSARSRARCSPSPDAVRWSPWVLEGVDELGQSFAADRDGPQDGRPPARRRVGVLDGVPHLEHPAELGLELAGTAVVRLVDDEHVGDLEDAGLRRLDAVTHPWGERDHGRVRRRGDLDLGLPDTHRLDDDVVEPRGIEHEHRLRRREGQSAEVAAGRHRADEDVGVGVVGLHPDPVAEQRPAGERRGRVHGQDGDRASLPRSSAAIALVSVDLPTPGDPVMPMTRALPSAGRARR
jgi:hypothetical protein